MDKLIRDLRIFYFATLMGAKLFIGVYYIAMDKATASDTGGLHEILMYLVPELVQS